MQKIPSYLITGFLGSGKTTFISHLLDTVFAGKKVALIENEIGEYSIDAKIVLSTHHVQIREINSGCLCCSVTNDFSLAITDILLNIVPEIIIIETTGIANPLSLLAIISSDSRLSLELIVTLVDALNIQKHITENLVPSLQIASADVILLSKVDLATESQINECEKTIAQLNSRAGIIHAVRGNVDLSMLEMYYSNVESRLNTTEHHHNHREVDNIEAFSVVLSRSITSHEFEVFLLSLPSNVYRAKGVVVLDNKPTLFHFVSGRYTFDYEWKGDSKNILIFIGKKILMDKQTIQSQIEKLK